MSIWKIFGHLIFEICWKLEFFPWVFSFFTLSFFKLSKLEACVNPCSNSHEVRGARSSKEPLGNGSKKLYLWKGSKLELCKLKLFPLLWWSHILLWRGLSVERTREFVAWGRWPMGRFWVWRRIQAHWRGDYSQGLDHYHSFLLLTFWLSFSHVRK